MRIGPFLLFDSALIGASSWAATHVHVGFAALGGAAFVALHASRWFEPRSSYFVPVTSRVEGPGLALTFDDGPDPAHTPRVLDLLGEAGARATFFVIGRHAEAHPRLVRRMVDEGHAVGIHSYDHPRSFATMPPGRMRRDLERCQAIVEAASGRRPRLFRPPIGITSPFVAFALLGTDLHVVNWSVRSLDTRARAPEEILARVTPGLAPGAIVLLHDGSEPVHPASRDVTVRALPSILAAMRARGIEGRALGLSSNDRVALAPG
ncbi:MAG: polysaccharide deacetylase family protein [Byssovorax sp.]